MAKKKKIVLGSVLKNKETGKPDYIKLDKFHAERLGHALLAAPASGLILNLESKTAQLKSFDEAVAAGKLKGDYVPDMRKRIADIPDFVRFQVTLLVDT